LSVAEQRYQAVMAVIGDGLSVSQVGEKVGGKPRAQSVLEPAQLANRLNFSVSVWLSIGLGQVLKPGLRNRRVRMIP
jgi:hypothetical protein